MNQDEKLKYSLTLRLKRSEIFFGPGVVEVLTLVEKTGSLNHAAKEMKMSYNKAWRIVQKAEREWGKALVESTIGGPNGGGTFLTDEAHSLLEKYANFEDETYRLVNQCFKTIFQTEDK